MVAEVVDIAVGQKYQTKAGIAEIVGTDDAGISTLFRVNCDWHMPIMLNAAEIRSLIEEGSWSLIAE